MSQSIATDEQSLIAVPFGADKTFEQLGESYLLSSLALEANYGALSCAIPENYAMKFQN